MVGAGRSKHILTNVMEGLNPTISYPPVSTVCPLSPL